MQIRTTKLITLLSVLAAAFLAAPSHAQPEWRFSGANRIVAVGDIHGAYSAFESVLRQTELIDASGRWTGGDTQLVIVGDMLDRGPDSRKAMDLIMQLQTEAPNTGGRVHVALGNHEVMNLTGDLRYVSEGEYAAFAAEESEAMRSAAFEQFRTAETADALESGSAEPADATLRADFDMSYPAGFFAHRTAFSPQGRYGAWLLAQPVLVVIDDWAFAHGGLAQAIQQFGADEINDILLRQLTGYTATMSRLTAAGILTPLDDFYSHPARIAAYAEKVANGNAAWPEGLKVDADRIVELNEAFIFGGSSPIWYRGNVGCSRLSERDRLDASLRVVGAEHLVVGHTPTADARVQSRMEQRLMRIDTGMLSDYYGGRASALVIEGSNVSVVYQNESGLAQPEPQPRRVGLRANGMTADDLEGFLREAEVIERVPLTETSSRLRLQRGDLEMDAEFTLAERAGVLPDVAAYRLDRLLGLEMVPVTIVRDLDGEPGSLQYLPPRVITEAQRSTRSLGGSAWCPLGDQFQAMYVFDSLIFNEGRTMERVRYSTDNFQLLLTGHDRSLSTKRGRPPHLTTVPLLITPAWASALEALEEESLDTALGDVLDRRRIRALLQRRDAMLESMVDE